MIRVAQRAPARPWLHPGAVLAALERELAAAPEHWLVILVVVAAGIVVGSQPLLIPVAICVGAVLGVLIMANERVALWALIPMIPLYPIVGVRVGAGLLEVLVLLLVTSWGARGLLRREWRVAFTPLLIPMLLVGFVFVLSSWQAYDASQNFSPKEILKWLELILVYLYVTSTHFTRRQVLLLAVLVVGSGAVEALWGLKQFLTSDGPGFYKIGPFLRSYGHFGQPNPFAGYLGLVLPLGVTLFLAGLGLPRPYGLGTYVPASWWTLPQRLISKVYPVRLLPWPVVWVLSLPNERLLVLGGVGAIAAAIVTSLSRGAWLGILIALLVLMALWGPRLRRWVIPIILAMGAFVWLVQSGFLPGGFTDRFLAGLDQYRIFDVRYEILSPQNWAVMERMAHWQAAWYMFLDHPWLGVGVGNYPAAYSDYQVGTWFDPLGHAHNYYLNLLAETGITGLLAFLILLVAAYGTCLRGLRGPAGRDPLRRAILVGVTASLVMFCVHMTFDNLLVHGLSIQLGLMLALAYLAARRIPSAEAEG